MHRSYRFVAFDEATGNIESCELHNIIVNPWRGGGRYGGGRSANRMAGGGGGSVGAAGYRDDREEQPQNPDW